MGVVFTCSREKREKGTGDVRVLARLALSRKRASFQTPIMDYGLLLVNYFYFYGDKTDNWN